jgi:hypothetical protein
VEAMLTWCWGLGLSDFDVEAREEGDRGDV